MPKIKKIKIKTHSGAKKRFSLMRAGSMAEVRGDASLEAVFLAVRHRAIENDFAGNAMVAN